MRNTLKVILGSSFAVAAVFLWACGPGINTNNTKTGSAGPPSPAPTTHELAAEREIYKQNCAKCHQDTGVGGKITVNGKELNPKDLTSDKMKNRSDQKLYEDISEGSPDDGMPAFKTNLSEAEIKSSVHYIRAELQKVSENQPK